MGPLEVKGPWCRVQEDRLSTLGTSDPVAHPQLRHREATAASAADTANPTQAGAPEPMQSSSGPCGDDSSSVLHALRPFSFLDPGPQKHNFHCWPRPAKALLWPQKAPPLLKVLGLGVRERTV